MSRVVVVGSGASGVQFAWSVLEKGHAVTMVDVGNPPPAPVNPADTFDELKANLDDPAAYLLGPRYEAVVFPNDSSEYYGFPPSKEYVFTEPQAPGIRAHGFHPLSAFGQGGLAETWTAGCYPFNDDDLEDFPFAYGDLAPYYSEVARRIGIAGRRDDLEPFLPYHEHILEPLELDKHSRVLLETYEGTRERCQRAGWSLGRSRLAVLSRDHDGRKPCSYSGRCLWGCPSSSLYTPSITLRRLRQHPAFTYVPHRIATHFNVDSRNRIRSVATISTERQASDEIPADRLVLAAGTLASSRIFLNSVRRLSGEVLTLTGLMDNPQVLVPFLNLRMIGQPFESSSYQYHQLSMGFEADDPKRYVHGQITTLKTAQVHPIVASVPLDLCTALRLFRNVHAALGVVNVNLHDERLDSNRLTIEPQGDEAWPRAVVECSSPASEGRRVRRAVRHAKKALRQLGCVVPPGMIHIRPRGSSVHYSGTLPMSTQAAPLTTSALCESHDFADLYFVDGTTYPFLPAKNITFTLMANAVRVADQAF